jgi:hypothetical protein
MMNWEAFGRKRLWHIPGGTQKTPWKPQPGQPASKPRCKLSVSCAYSVTNRSKPSVIFTCYCCCQPLDLCLIFTVLTSNSDSALQPLSYTHTISVCLYSKCGTRYELKLKTINWNLRIINWGSSTKAICLKRNWNRSPIIQGMSHSGNMLTEKQHKFYYISDLSNDPFKLTNLCSIKW